MLHTDDSCRLSRDTPKAGIDLKGVDGYCLLTERELGRGMNVPPCTTNISAGFKSQGTA